LARTIKKLRKIDGVEEAILGLQEAIAEGMMQLSPKI